jgi:hypothetical protein
MDTSLRAMLAAGCEFLSRTGTFCSADPLAGSADDPQSWNRYAYGRNDPIDITDPSGQHWWSWALDIVGIAAMVFQPEIDDFLGGLFSDGAEASADAGGTGTLVDETWLIPRAGASVVTAAAGTGDAAAIGSGLGGEIGAGAAAAGLASDQPKAQNNASGAAPASPNLPKKNCPPVPTHPKDADVDANISSTEAANAADQTQDKLVAKVWWADKVQTRGDWDYKKQSLAYDDFGNFNYGATGTVFNYSLSTLEHGAAAARFLKSPLTQLRKYGFGNDPHKNDMIRQGMQYKQNHCGHF